MVTLEERESIIRDAVAEISSLSIALEELDTVSEITAIDSLPAYKNEDGTLVRVPINILSDPVQETIEQVTEIGRTAKAAANTASTAATKANSAAEAANTALENALNVIANVNVVVDGINTKVDNALNGSSIKTLTADEYDALETKNENTLYFILEE